MIINKKNFFLGIILLIVGCGEVSTKDNVDTNSEVHQANSTLEDEDQEEINKNTSPFSEVKEVYDGDTLSVGTFSSYDVNYYKLEMPKNGNLVSDSRNSIYLYDKDLNPLTFDKRSSINGNINLDAGSYIIKFDHRANQYSFTLNSNVLFNQNDLPKISNGTYTGIGVQYYLLEMPKNGNLVSDSRNSIYLYDKDLNPLTFDKRSSINGNINLDAGSYIIKFDHRANQYSFTLNSNVLN